MSLLSNYTALEEIHQDSKIKIFRGKIAVDQTPVIIKLLKKEAFNLVEISRLINEFEITQSLDINGIIRPIKLEPTDSYYALIFTDVGAVPLRQYIDSRRVSPWLFIDIAIQLAETISRLHGRGIIHRDIKPENIFINLDTRKVYISGFGNAIRISSENKKDLSSINYECSPEYMSPEQTGRLNLAIDQRSDLYSLGVVFYEILIGELPIKSGSRAEFIHAHITQRPQPPNQINPDISSVISDIIMKLLDKDVERRYQSAYGLLWDIRKCRKQLIETGKIDVFAIGQKDVFTCFQLPNKLYGRDGEKELLKTSFERVCKESVETILVSGYPGTGKTALVNDVIKPLVLGKGYFIYGKMDQLQKNIPYAPFVDALENLIMQLMAEPESELNQWKKRIINALGKNGSVITEIIPKLEYIIGKQPPVDVLPPREAENRFLIVFREFISVFARKGQPLVIFLDDLQWADTACIQLINYLTGESNLNSLLFVGAYRDNEVNEDHPLVEMLEGMGENQSNKIHISLMPLNWKQTLMLVADTLHTAPENVITLSEVLYQKSGGNSFFLRQLLILIHEKELLYFDTWEGCWKWEIEAIQKLNVGGNVLEFFMKKLQRLTQETREILKFASCIGDRFDLRTLAGVCCKSVEETASGLVPSVHDGIVLPVTNLNEDLSLGYTQLETCVFKFLHDKVQQAVYSLIDENEKKEKHLAVGRQLLRNSTCDTLNDKLILIMDHFSRSLELVDDPTERLELARYNLMAGIKAKKLAAYSSALKYFRLGKALLPETKWDNTNKLSYDLYLELAQAEYLSGNIEVGEELFNIVIQNTKTEVERADIYSLKVILYASIGKYEESISTGIEALKNLGVRIPMYPTKIDYARELLIFKWNMLNKKIEDLIDLLEMDDPVQIKIAELLSRLSYVTMPFDTDLYSYIIIKSGNHVVRNGNTYMAPVGYFGYGITVGTILGDYRSGHRYAKVCIHMVEKYGQSSSKAIIYFVVGAFIIHWNLHASFGLEYLEKAILYGTEVGDVLIIGYAHCLLLENSYLLGNPLAKMAEIVQEKRKIAKGLKHDNFAINTEIYKKVVSILQGLKVGSFASGISEFEKEEFIKLVQRDKASLATYYFHKMYLCYMEGDYIEALSAAEKVESLYDAILGFFISAEYKLYHSLVIAAIYEELPFWDRKRLWRVLKKNQRQLKKWSKFCKENFLHKYLLVEAEIARLQNKDSEAVTLYSEAIQSAQENGYIQDEALANELMAKFYISRDLIKAAKVYMRDSCWAYNRWGALTKVKQLQEQYPSLAEIPNLNEGKGDGDKLLEDMLNISMTTSGKTTSSLDTYFIDKAVESISRGTDINEMLESFLDITVQCIGADRGCLILEKRGELFIKAIKDSNSPVAVTKVLPLEQSNKLSKTVVRYVSRTHETVIVNHGEHSGIFDADPYIIQSNPKSIASFPLLFQGTAVGVLYFENSFIPGVFTTELLESLKLLFVQMACIKKIQLYLENGEDNVKTQTSDYLVDPLTEREMEVLGLIAEGLSNKEIADKLELTINTVKGYIKNIYQKLGVNRRVQVITKARELNILKKE